MWCVMSGNLVPVCVVCILWMVPSVSQGWPELPSLSWLHLSVDTDIHRDSTRLVNARIIPFLGLKNEMSIVPGRR